MVSAIHDMCILHNRGFKPLMGLWGLMDYFIKQDRSWDLDRLREWFVPVDMVDILNISLGLREEEDSVYWFYDPKGFYSVRRGCKLAIYTFNCSKSIISLYVGRWKII